MKTCVILISAGVGPAPVRRFVRKLSERLLGQCEERLVAVEAVVMHGDHGAPTSVELIVSESAKMVLAHEFGTHMLVARAEERGRADRKRWFAGVTVHDSPEGESGERGGAIDPRDLTVTATRGS